MEKCSSFRSWNKLLSILFFSFFGGKKLFGSYLLQLREARRREEPTQSHFMGLSPFLSTFQLKQCCCLKPPGARLTLIHSAGSTDCHSSCQSTPIYLKGSRLLRRSRQGVTRAGGREGRREMMEKKGCEGEDWRQRDAGEGKKWDKDCLGTGLDLGFSISISVTEHHETESQGCLSCRSSLISFPAFGGTSGEAEAKEARGSGDQGGGCSILTTSLCCLFC